MHGELTSWIWETRVIISMKTTQGKVSCRGVSKTPVITESQTTHARPFPNLERSGDAGKESEGEHFH